ncbi:MAG: LamG-like jellyroll fold domain-containing protein [Pirellulaceae bacterium]
MRKKFYLFVCVAIGICAIQVSAAELLFIGADPDPTFGDDSFVYEYLTDVLGHDVVYLSGDASTTADADSVDLVIISSTLGSGTVRGKFQDTATPVLNWEEAIFDGTTANGNLAMSQGGENGTALPGTQIQILDPTHPLAAGLRGTVDFSFDPIPNPHATGQLGPGVVAIAGFPQQDANEIILSQSGIGMHVGSNQNGGAGFSGLMDEVAIFSAALSFEVDANQNLTGGDIFTLYRQGISALGQTRPLPQVYFSFDEGDDFFVSDQSGNGFDGELEGTAELVQGEAAPGVGGAGAMFLDGAGSLNVPDMIREGGNLAYSFWFNADSNVYGDTFDVSDSRVDFFYGNGEGGTVRPHLSANRNNEPIGIYVNSDGDLDTPFEATTDSFSTDEWHHFAVTWDGDVGSVFVDGVLETQTRLDSPAELYTITAVDVGGELLDGTLAAGKRLNFPIQDTGFASLTDDGLKLFEAAINWLLDSTPAVRGDFNGDGQLTVADINLLSNEIAAETNGAAFDLNSDGQVNDTELDLWVVDIKNTWFGDANLDGEFSSADFVQIFTAGLFEKDEPADWSSGDWNADGRFNSGDFVKAFQGGGFELGPRPAVSAVPEPHGLAILFLGLCGLMQVRRKPKE